MGYDFESKGFHIYWPTKHTVSVKRNVVFNDDDILGETATIPGDMSEGEKDKVIQAPETVTSDYSASESQPEATPKTEESNEPQNYVPIPTGPEPADALPPNNLAEDPDEEPKLGRGHHVAKKTKGAYA